MLRSCTALFYRYPQQCKVSSNCQVRRRYYRTCVATYDREIKKLYSQEVAKVIKEIRRKVSDGTMTPEEAQKAIFESVNQTRTQQVKEQQNNSKLQQRAKIVTGDRPPPPNAFHPQRTTKKESKDDNDEE
jgi:polyhydroxyalkanoate synthesis regulator phasin